MKGLNLDQVKSIIEADSQKVRRPRTGGGKTGSGKMIDVSIRDHSTWFKLAHKIFDAETGQANVKCANPNCQDPRPESKARVVALVNGVEMCRYCFLDGYMMSPESQLTING